MGHTGAALRDLSVYWRQISAEIALTSATDRRSFPLTPEPYSAASSSGRASELTHDQRGA